MTGRTPDGACDFRSESEVQSTRRVPTWQDPLGRPAGEMTESTGETLSDEALVERARESPRDDLRPFDELVLRHRARVVANCRYLTRQPESAEDLAQDIFVKAYFALPRFRGGSSFRTWLQRIKINHCFDHLKSQRGRTFVDLTAPELSAAPELSVVPMAERDLIQAEARDSVVAAVDALPDSLRIPLTLRDLDGLAYQEIAETLGLSLSAVKMRILRARRELRAYLNRRRDTASPLAAIEPERETR